MKRFAIAACMLLPFAAQSRAEEAAREANPMHHHDGHPGDIVQDAYALADAGEGTYDQLRYRYPQVAYAANEVHERASDLYYAARNDDHGVQPMHHHDGDLLPYYYRVRDAYNYYLSVVNQNGCGYDPEVQRGTEWIDDRFDQVSVDLEQQ